MDSKKQSEIMINSLSLYQKAKEAALAKSYSPYSGVSVGAAALLSNGEVVSAANIENSSYSVTICAERSLLCNVIAQHRGVSIVSIAVAAYKDNSVIDISPCGICRQAILEQEMVQNSDIQIIFCHNSNLITTTSVKELLPYAFALRD